MVMYGIIIYSYKRLDYSSLYLVQLSSFLCECYINNFFDPLKQRNCCYRQVKLNFIAHKLLKYISIHIQIHFHIHNSLSFSFGKFQYFLLCYIQCIQYTYNYVNTLNCRYISYVSLQNTKMFALTAKRRTPVIDINKISFS